jgi:hypothetical protein
MNGSSMLKLANLSRAWWTNTLEFDTLAKLNQSQIIALLCDLTENLQQN